MKKRYLLVFILTYLLSACSSDTTVQVTRHPLVKFNYNAISWTADTYDFTAPAQVVAYPAGTTGPGKLYNRFTLQAYGKDDKGTRLQLNLMFDTQDNNQLIGLYRPRYSSDKGLSQVQLFNLDNNNLAAYELCKTDTTAQLHIQRQSQTERLISGNFQMTLCNTRDSTQKINITNGILTDIHY